MALHKYSSQVALDGAMVAAQDCNYPLLYHTPDISLTSSSWLRFFYVASITRERISISLSSPSTMTASLFQETFSNFFFCLAHLSLGKKSQLRYAFVSISHAVLCFFSLSYFDLNINHRFTLPKQKLWNKRNKVWVMDRTHSISREGEKVPDKKIDKAYQISAQ